MCEGFLRVEMHAILDRFIFMESKADERNMERIFFTGLKMLLQTTPLMRKYNLILEIFFFKKEGK